MLRPFGLLAVDTSKPKGEGRFTTEVRFFFNAVEFSGSVSDGFEGVLHTTHSIETFVRERRHT